MLNPRERYHLDVSTFYTGGPRLLSEWETIIKKFLDRGQPFQAFDLAETALVQFPESFKLKQLCALALIRVGALDEAKKIMEPFRPGLQVKKENLQQVYKNLQTVLHSIAQKSTSENATEKDMENLSQLLVNFSKTSKMSLPKIPELDEESLGILAKIYKVSWERNGNLEDLATSRDIYFHAFRETGGYWTGINAASLSWLLGEHKKAKNLAKEVLECCNQNKPDQGEIEQYYWFLATQGEAYLLLGDEKQSIRYYKRALKQAGDNHAFVVSSKQQLKLLENHGFAVPDLLFNILKQPTIVIFTGHMLDRDDRLDTRFPHGLEQVVYDKIKRELDKIDAKIGYCSAACGSDLLFIEAMLKRKAEVNIVLPFNLEDFISVSVSYAGDEWLQRFNDFYHLVHSVKYATTERYFGDNELFKFAAKVYQGYANLRAMTLESSPYMLAVWDETSVDAVGGTSDIIQGWSDDDKLIIIPLKKLLKQNKPFVENSNRLKVKQKVVRRKEIIVKDNYQKRLIKTMMFADIVGYSKLEEAYTPFYIYEFLERIAKELAEIEDKPQFVNTWGDAIFVVMEKAIPLVNYSVKLLNTIIKTDWTQFGLPSQMNIRIGLHAGPVFKGRDPISCRDNFFGTHVNRAARIEPITVPGSVYASEQFATLLSNELMDEKRKIEQAGSAYESPFFCEYIGTHDLAKEFGKQAIFHIRPRVKIEEINY